MDLHIEEITAKRLDEYAQISIGFWVKTMFQVHPVDNGLGGLQFVEESVSPPYFKDYDHTEAEGSPIYWPKQFDISQWGFFLALRGETPVGGAAVALHTNGVNMLEGRQELAVLWDLRVQTEERGKGIGKALFQFILPWMQARGAQQLKIETQNINVGACRFYARMGCQLGMVHRYGYAAVSGCEHEIMLCWYYPLM